MKLPGAIAAGTCQAGVPWGHSSPNLQVFGPFGEPAFFVQGENASSSLRDGINKQRLVLELQQINCTSGPSACFHPASW